MKTITIDTYEFDELDDAAKEKARDWFRTASYNDTFWSECELEEAEDQASIMGIELDRDRDNSAKIFWSGFCSQGDGACFSGTWRACDVKPATAVAIGWGPCKQTTELKRIAGVFADIAKEYPESSFTVKHSGRYCHENCTEFDYQFPDDDIGVDWPADKKHEWDTVCKALKENAKDLMRWIYRQLEAAYESENSDECVDDNIRCNNYAFTKAGKRTTVL